jgi:cytochrome c oxidase subunit 2
MLGWLPEGISTYAGDIDAVFRFIYYLTSVIFLLVTVLLIWFLIQYRAQPGRRAVYSHGNTALELTWTIIPAIVFIGIFFVSRSTWSDIKASAPAGDVQVRVVAKQFEWEFHYPGPDGQFDTTDDKMLKGELHVPVDKVVRVVLRGTDVIHSFFVPVFRLKQDALPGRDIIAWFQATKTGRYEVPCAELCGPGHSGMKGWVTIHSAADYQKWVSEQWPSS